MIGTYTAIPTTDRRLSQKILRLFDLLSACLFWFTSILSGIVGSTGATMVAAQTPGKLREMWKTLGIPPTEAVNIGTLLAGLSLGLLIASTQARFANYTGVTSFRRGSTYLPVSMLGLVSATYLGAALVISVDNGIAWTGLLVTIILAVASAFFGSLQRAQENIRTAKLDLIAAIDDLMIALKLDDNQAVARAALVFNRRYSTRTALRHPMVPSRIQLAFDTLLARLVPGLLLSAPKLEQELQADAFPARLTQKALPRVPDHEVKRTLIEGCAWLRDCLLDA